MNLATDLTFENLLILTSPTVDLKDLFDTAALQHLIAFLMHSDCQFVDVRLKTVISFCIYENSVNFFLQSIRLQQIFESYIWLTILISL